MEKEEGIRKGEAANPLTRNFLLLLLSSPLQKVLITPRVPFPLFCLHKRGSFVLSTPSLLLLLSTQLHNPITINIYSAFPPPSVYFLPPFSRRRVHFQGKTFPSVWKMGASFFSLFFSFIPSRCCVPHILLTGSEERKLPAITLCMPQRRLVLQWGV